MVINTDICVCVSVATVCFLERMFLLGLLENQLCIKLLCFNLLCTALGFM